MTETPDFYSSGTMALPATDEQPRAAPQVGPDPYGSGQMTGVPPAPPSLLNRSWLVPGKQALGPVTSDVTDLRNAFGEGYRSVPSESVTRPGERSILSPETQTGLRQSQFLGGWPGAAANLVSDTLGTAAGGIAGVGNSAVALADMTLKSLGLPPALRRDIFTEATNLPFAAETKPPLSPRAVLPRDVAPLRELTQPPAPALSDILQRQRAAPSTDPVTNAAISLLQRTTQPTSVPLAPTPFAPTVQPRPSPAPSGGLLNVPPFPGAPLPGVASAMTADEMLANSQGWYSPADKQAAQGALLHPQAGDSVRKILTDAIPTDPEKRALVGDTPLVQMGKAVEPYMGQPMSFDTAMSYDRQLTGRIQTALRAGDNTLASQLGDAQRAIRNRMQSFGPDDTTGDATALANVAKARQGYTQYVKQSQIEDIQYRASLRPEDRQSTYVRNQARAMLGSDETRNWTPEERAVLEQAVRSGNIGVLANTGISLVKPVTRAIGAGAGSWVGGVPGAIVGGEVGGDVGATLQARLRAALSKITLDKVSQQLSQGMPPPPNAP